ncbi:zinc finger, CCHC-type containing protein [Tanacetum coccineum]
MPRTSTRFNIEKLNESDVQKHGGSKHVGFKQHGSDVKIGVHMVQVQKRVWFEVKLQGAQRNRKVELRLDDEKRVTHFKVFYDDNGKVAKLYFETNKRKSKTMGTPSAWLLHPHEADIEPGCFDGLFGYIGLDGKPNSYERLVAMEN